MPGPSAAIRVQCPNATHQYDGLMSAGDKAILDASGVALNDVNIYLSATGSDSNSGFSPSDPVLTLAKAVSLIPASWTKGMKIFAGAGTFSGAGAAGMRDGRVGPNATPIVIVGQVVDVGGGTRTGVGSTNLLLTDPAAAFANILGKAVRITSGASNGQRRLVAAFTGTTITPNAPFTGITGAETFVVEGAATEFTNFSTIFYGGMRDIKLSGATVFAAGSGLFGAENVEFNSTGNLIFFTAQVQLQSNALVWAADGASNPFSALRTQCGAYLHAGIHTFTFGSMCPSAFIVAENTTMAHTSDSVIVYSGQVGKNATFTVARNAVVTLVPGATGLPNVLDGQATPSATAGLVDVTQNGLCLLSASTTGALLMIQNSGGHAVRASSGARLYANGVGGAGNAGVGFLVERGSIANLIGPAGVPNATVTGAGGDVKVGALAAQAYATLAAQSGQGETDGAGNSTLNRIIVSTAF